MNIIPLPTRNDVVTRLAKDHGKAHEVALRAVADKLSKATALPVCFTIAELGPNADVQRKIVQALEFAGWKCTPCCTETVNNGVPVKTLDGYEVE